MRSRETQRPHFFSGAGEGWPLCSTCICYMCMLVCCLTNVALAAEVTVSQFTVTTNLNPPDLQSTGPTLLNPPAQHFSIHRPNTPRSTGPTISIHRADIVSIHRPNNLNPSADPRSIHRHYNPPT